MRHLLQLSVVVFTIFIIHGCADEPNAIYVLGNTIPQAGCTVAASETGPFRPRGILDIALTNRYIMYPTIQNQMLSSATAGMASPPKMSTKAEAVFTNQLIEGNNVAITGAQIQYSPPPSFPVPMPDQNVTVSAVVPVNAGLTSLGLEIIPTDLGNALANAGALSEKGMIIPVLVHIRFEGISSSGTVVQSNRFTYPIDICNGCLVTYPPSADIPSNGIPDCQKDDYGSNDESSVLSSIIPPCDMGQDDDVDCRLCHLHIGDSTKAGIICEPTQ